MKLMQPVFAGVPGVPKNYATPSAQPYENKIAAPAFEGFFHRKSSPLSKYIDDTKLTYKDGENHAEAIRALCKEARDNHFYAVCVRPDMVKLAKSELEGSGVKVATVIGFPQKKTKLFDEMALYTIGDIPVSQKLAETIKAVKAGADEIDLVMNVQQFLEEADEPQQLRTIREFNLIKAFAQELPDKHGKFGDPPRVLHRPPRKLPVKVIIETDLLSPEQIVKATKACISAGVAMVKTSTGMIENGHGARVEDIALIRKTLEEAGVAKKIGIKASGGVKTKGQAEALIAAGATRLGTSNGVAIVQGTEAKSAY